MGKKVRTKEEQPSVATVAQQLSPPHHHQESDRPGTHGPWRARRHQLSPRVSQRDHGASRTQQVRNTKDQPGRGAGMDPEDPELPLQVGSSIQSVPVSQQPISSRLTAALGTAGLGFQVCKPSGCHLQGSAPGSDAR